MTDAAFRILSFLLTNHHDRFSPKAGKPANDGLIFPKTAITSKTCKILKQAVKIVEKLRTLGVAGNLNFLPRC